jgi:hypothetical protein
LPGVDLNKCCVVMVWLTKNGVCQAHDLEHVGLANCAKSAFMARACDAVQSRVFDTNSPSITALE